VQHARDLEVELERTLRTRPADEWIAVLRRAGVPAGPVNSVPEAFAFAEQLGLEPVIEGPHGSGRTFRSVRNPVRLSETPVSVDRAPPRLGEHDAEIRAWLASP
jgi:crotonobetainyl-CoA:carnitine CoA-transferase CaiB-like acyl-CoA transferase